MPFAVDFTKVEGAEPIPEGLYLASVEEATEGLSGTNNPKVDVRWKIQDGPYKDRRVFDTLSFHPDAMFRTIGVLKRLLPNFDPEFAGMFDAQNLVGAVAMIYVIIEPARRDEETGEEYDARNKVKRVKKADVDLDELV